MLRWEMPLCGCWGMSRDALGTANLAAWYPRDVHVVVLGLPKHVEEGCASTWNSPLILRRMAFTSSTCASDWSAVILGVLSFELPRGEATRESAAPGERRLGGASDAELALETRMHAVEVCLAAAAVPVLTSFFADRTVVELSAAPLGFADVKRPPALHVSGKSFSELSPGSLERIRSMSFCIRLTSTLRALLSTLMAFRISSCMPCIASLAALPSSAESCSRADIAPLLEGYD
mmetsp:Transcript_42347/g.122502  ORF Transcript_42347/g.122502 Transcript_42347/m.122502 type:complete len:234 (+) Transcript_42347:1164-1865(+)